MANFIVTVVGTLIVIFVVFTVLSAIFALLSPSNGQNTQNNYQPKQDDFSDYFAKQQKDQDRMIKEHNRTSTDFHYDKTNFFGSAYHENSDGSHSHKDGNDGRPFWW